MNCKIQFPEKWANRKICKCKLFIIILFHLVIFLGKKIIMLQIINLKKKIPCAVFCVKFAVANFSGLFRIHI